MCTISAKITRIEKDKAVRGWLSSRTNTPTLSLSLTSSFIIIFSYKSSQGVTVHDHKKTHTSDKTSCQTWRRCTVKEPVEKPEMNDSENKQKSEETAEESQKTRDKNQTSITKFSTPAILNRWNTKNSYIPYRRETAHVYAHNSPHKNPTTFSPNYPNEPTYIKNQDIQVFYLFT